MKTSQSLALASGLALLSPFAGAADITPLDVKTLSEFNKLHSVAVHAGTEQIVFGQNTATGSDLFIMPVAGGDAKRLTTHSGKEHSVQFSQNGDAIYFLANRTGSTQLFRLPLAGGEAEQISQLPLGVTGYKLAKDNSKVVFSLEVVPSCDTLACSKKAIAKKDAQPFNAMSYDKLPVRHWDTWEDGLRSHLFVANLNGTVIKDAENITQNWDTDIPAKPFSGMEEVTFTPDNKAVVFAAKAPAKDQMWHTNFDLFQVDLETKTHTNLTEANKAWDSHPTFSDDGRFMAYLAMKTPGYEADRFGLMLKDLRTGELKEVAPLWDRSISSFTFAPNNRAVYVVAQDVGQKSIYEIATNFGDTRKVFSDGYASDVHLVGDKVVFSRHTLGSPKDLYSINRDGSNFTQLTALNKDKLAKLTLGEFEQFSFSGWNDETVYGYLVKPAGFDAEKRYPVAFLVHGGPQGSFGNMFHYRWNAQLWAAQGYVVVMVDFHGSTGYGREFTHSISRDWGGKPLEDLQKGLAYVGKNYAFADTNNACALGASYGGYMMNWIAGNWNSGFKCLINHAGLFDMKSFYQSTEELWFPEYEMGGPFYANTPDYEKYNPANYVENWQTPMLVIHGLKDYRVPYAQGLGAYTTLQRKGIDSRLVIYPDENHWILNKDNLAHWYGEVFAWMDKYLKTN